MSAVELEHERRISPRRVARTGDMVTLTGVRGTFKVLGFRGDDVELYGGKVGRVKCLRTMSASRIARVLRRIDRAE